MAFNTHYVYPHHSRNMGRASSVSSLKIFQKTTNMVVHQRHARWSRMHIRTWKSLHLMYNDRMLNAIENTYHWSLNTKWYPVEVTRNGKVPAKITCVNCLRVEDITGTFDGATTRRTVGCSPLNPLGAEARETDLHMLYPNGGGHEYSPVNTGQPLQPLIKIYI